MIRKQIYISQENEAFLKALAVERGVNEAEIVREALDQMKDRIAEAAKRSAAWAAIDAMVAKVTAENADRGEAYTWKREDAYDDARYRRPVLRVAESTAEYDAEQDA